MVDGLQRQPGSPTVPRQGAMLPHGHQPIMAAPNSSLMSFTTLKNAFPYHFLVLTDQCSLNPQIIRECQEWAKTKDFSEIMLQNIF